jgi:hypothetical protein
LGKTGRGQDRHGHVEYYGERSHRCVEGHPWEAGPVGDGRIPLLAGWLAEVDLDYEKGEVEKDAGRDYAEDGEAVGANGEKAEVGEEQGQLKS